jgi:hypothetical protein
LGPRSRCIPRIVDVLLRRKDAKLQRTAKKCDFLKPNRTVRDFDGNEATPAFFSLVVPPPLLSLRFSASLRLCVEIQIEECTPGFLNCVGKAHTA